MATQTDASANGQAVQLDDEAKRLKLEQVKAEARKSIVEADSATLAAQLPTSDIKPLEGKVDVGSGVGLVAQMVAYRLLDDAADTIVNAVVDRKGSGQASVLVVEDRLLTGSDWSYEMIQHQLQVHETVIDEAVTALEPPEKKAAKAQPHGAGVTEFVPAAVALAPAIIGAAATLVGMFRTDYAIASKDVKIGTTPLVASVANRLIGAGQNVTVDQFCLAARSRIIADFWSLREKRNSLEKLSLGVKSRTLAPADRLLDDLRAERKGLLSARDKALSGETTGHKNAAELQRLADELKGTIKEEEAKALSARANVARAESVIAQFDAFVTAVTTATGGANPPLLTAALREQLHGAQQPAASKGKQDSKTTDTHLAPYTHVLYVGIEGSGGETITRKSLFGPSGQVGYMGGAQISYLLLDVAQNRIVAAGTESLLGHLAYDLKTATAQPLKRVDLHLPRRKSERSTLTSPGDNVVRPKGGNGAPKADQPATEGAEAGSKQGAGARS